MKDLTGQRFGHLTVLRKYGHKGGRVCWECLCDCGNLHYVITCNLTTGHTTRCSKCSNSVVDLTGQVFGQLTVIDQNKTYRKENNIKGYHAYWNCLCSCGNTTIAKGTDLSGGKTTQCKQCAGNQLIDETGNRYGYLTILNYLRTENHQTIWLAQCDCGNQCEVRINDLRRGRAKLSCGCKSIRSKGELEIEELLKQNKINYQAQYVFDNLVGQRNRRLPYDFAILTPDNQVQRLIEFDGQQHNISVNYFGGDKVLNRRKELDKIKNNYAKEHHIPLIRISYDKLSKITIEMLLGDEYLI